MTKIVTVDFRSDTLFAVERDDGVFVAVTPICDALGLDAKRQRDRIHRDPILSEGEAMMALPSAGGMQETFCLRLDLVHGWLFTIDESRVKDEETRQKVLAYKRECYVVLHRHFYGKAAQAVEKKNIIEAARDLEEPDSLKLRMIAEARQVFGVSAAGELWFRLQLPITASMLHNPRQGELLRWNPPRSEVP